MDPEVHDRPLYIQTIAWSIAVVFGVSMVSLIVVAVVELIDNVACAGGGC